MSQSGRAAAEAPVRGRPLTAAEEKARLKAMYEAEDRGSSRPAPMPMPLHQQSPYPSPPPSNGYHDYHDGAARATRGVGAYAVHEGSSRAVREERNGSVLCGRA